MSALVLAMPEEQARARAIAAVLGLEAADIEVHRFPDGEARVRVPAAVSGRPAVLVCGLHHPDPKVLPLWFAARTARELGASRVVLVAPYLAYMRQDRRFEPGQAVSARLFAALLSGALDALVTVDPHLHRVHDLAEIYPIETRVLHAAPALAGWIRDRVARPLLVGPDEESAQWVRAVADRVGAPSVVLLKERLGDRQVSVSVPEVQRWRDHTPVLVDDIVSTARTMAETVGHLLAAGLSAPVCVGVHGLFVGDALSVLQRAGAGRIATCNTVPHETNAIDLDPLLAAAVAEVAGS